MSTAPAAHPSGPAPDEGHARRDAGPHSARSDIGGGLAWLALGAAIVVESLRMDRFESMGASVYTMPGLVPGCIGALLAAMGTALALRGWRRSRRERGVASPVAGRALLDLRMLGMLAATLGYSIGLVGRVPFAPATFVFLAVFMAAYAPPGTTPVRRIATAAITAAVATAVIALVFEHAFLVRLP